VFDFLKQRSMQAEQMDNLDLSGTSINSTLDQLSHINKYLGNNKAVLSEIKKDILSSTGSLKIVDLGCGGGDLVLAIAKFAASHHKDVSLIGIDGNPHILEYAQNKSSAFSSVQYEVHDILADDFQLPVCDILISSHFMYHFSDAQLIAFLSNLKSCVRSKILISELQRSSISYVLFSILSRVLFFSSMIRKDGLTAISRSFRRSEIVAIFEKAGFSDYRVSWKWAFRYLVEVEV